MSFFRDLNLPVILYVARPLDSRKGLQTFLDAIDCLTTLGDLPSFLVWIVGGSPAELEYVDAMVRARASLQNLRQGGRVTVWGRVGHDSLAELESRAAVVVMPSSREQFPITVPEVLMCGTPIIASHVDGYVDSILEGETGTLLHVVDDAALLTNVLSAYLKNQPMREWYGETASDWARFAFSREATFGRFEQLYRRADRAGDLMFRSAGEWRSHRMERCAARISDLLDTKISDVVLTGDGPHTCFTFSIADGTRYFAKAFSGNPETDGSLFCLESDLWPPRAFEEYQQRALFLADNDAATHAVAFLPEEWVIVFEHGETIKWTDRAELHRALSGTARTFRDYRRLAADSATTKVYREAARAAYENPAAIAELDRVSAALNAEAFDLSIRRFVQTHPQVELRRFQAGFERQWWSLPQRFVVRANALIDFVLNSVPFADVIPELGTGSSKEEHLLRIGSRIVTCDLDALLYCVGPVDEAHYLYKRTMVEGHGPAEMMADIQRFFSDPLDRYLALCWCVNDWIYDSIARVVEGNPVRMQRFMGLSHGLFEHAWPLLRDHKSRRRAQGQQVPA